MKRVLLCPPLHYGVQYVINPWMALDKEVNGEVAARQWAALRTALGQLRSPVEVHELEALPGWPDLVFTANAGLVVGRRCLLSRFRYVERQGETTYHRAWFRSHGFVVEEPPAGVCFEGEGDALFCGGRLYCGYGFRTEWPAVRWLAERLACHVVPLQLVDARFYHLDTCFCPLGRDAVAWYPGAFDDAAQVAVRMTVPVRVELREEEALRFGCNAVVLGDEVLIPAGCPDLVDQLARRSMRVQSLEMGEFIKAGGACKCLVLLLNGGPG